MRKTDSSRSKRRSSRDTRTHTLISSFLLTDRKVQFIFSLLVYCEMLLIKGSDKGVIEAIRIFFLYP